MFGNSHFALATHALTALWLTEHSTVTSTTLAESVGTNPAFLRTLLGRLKEAGLVEVALGKGGGARLAISADEITLWDVYRAVDQQPAMTLHKCEPSKTCMVGRNILPVLEDLMEDVEAAVESELSARTVADVAKSIRKRG